MFRCQGSIARARDNNHHGCYRNFVILCPGFMPVARDLFPGFSLPEYNSAIIYQLRNRASGHFRIRFSELRVQSRTTAGIVLPACGRCLCRDDRRAMFCLDFIQHAEFRSVVI